MSRLIEVLRKGFRGTKPETNFAGFLELCDGDVTVPGEEILRWVRLGWLEAFPVTGTVDIIKGGNAGPYGEIPDIEITHSYFLTPLGEREIERQSQT